MKKILLPIDGSPRSLRTIQEIKQSYDPKETEITILLVTPEPRPHKMTDDNDEVKPMPDHDADPVPYLLYDSRKDTGLNLPYCEESGLKGTAYAAGAPVLMRKLFEQL